MFLKNIQFTFRNLWRDKFYTLLNGSGLAIGIAAALFIFLWANDELSFDDFHSKSDRIYRVISNMSFGGNDEKYANAPFPLEETARTQIPEIEKITLIGDLWNTVIRYDQKKFDIQGAKIVHAAFFDMFDFSFLHGNAETAFAQPTNVVLTKTMAEQIYGTTDVIGQPLTLTNKMEMTVSAVLEDIPGNSHLQFKLLIPFEGNIERFYQESARHWGAFNFTSYVMLRPNINVAVISEKLSALIPNQEEKEANKIFELQALSDVYLGSNHLAFSRAPRGDKNTIGILSIIGLLILVIACINYVNMSTARSAHKAKATSVRKIIGATQGQLFSQYMLEAVALILISSIVAFCLTHLCLSWFEDLSGKHFTADQLYSNKVWMIFIGTALCSIALAGIYPALQLSAFRPIDALKGSNFKGVAGKAGLRKFLVVSQFACSGVLMICTLIMLVQMNYVKNQKLGYEREQVFSFRCSDSDVLVFKNELEKQAGVEAVTVSSELITDISNRYGGFDFEGKDPAMDSYLYRASVGDQFPDFFDLQLKEGRWFRPGNRDSSSFILNETAVKKLGIENPIGKWMEFNGMKGSIVGVAKDFHFRSFHHEIDQLIFVQEFRWGMKRLYVKTTGDKAATAIASTQKIFADLEPNALFNYSFLDESYDKLYKTETRSSNLLAIFAGLAIFISCLGILGLATYTAERRRKEIGIRKVLGASVSNIVGLLSGDFIKLVLIALALAAPVAWYFMDTWLDNFAYRVNVEWWMFALAGLLAISIAFFTVSFQSVKAALANPSDSLKSE